LYYTTNLPHGPQIVDDLRDLTDRKDIELRSREWGAMVKRLDISVGKIIQELKKCRRL
jgi:arylsulfatase A